MQCSIALLQETHLNEEEHQKLKREWVDQVYSSSYEKHKKRGVAILFSKSVFFHCETVYQDAEGWYVMVVGTIARLKITILNVYAPNEDCPHFFKKLAHLIADNGEGILLMGGDLNCVLSNRLDRLPTSSKPQNRMSKSLLNMMKKIRISRCMAPPPSKQKRFHLYVSSAWELLKTRSFFVVKEGHITCEKLYDRINNHFRSQPSHNDRGLWD